MDIFSGSKFFTWLFDKIIEKNQLWKTKKEHEKNEKIIRSRLRSIFTSHENEIKDLFTDILNEMKQQLAGKEDDKSNWLIWKIEEVTEPGTTDSEGTQVSTSLVQVHQDFNSL